MQKISLDSTCASHISTLKVLSIGSQWAGMVAFNIPITRVRTVGATRGTIDFVIVKLVTFQENMSSASGDVSD